MDGKKSIAYKHKIWPHIEHDILPLVKRPGRYLGNELNAVIKDHSGRFRVVLAFPDVYEIGASYLGQQILYHLLNLQEDVVAERVYQVWPDMAAMLRQHGLPLFSLETSTPLAEFDLIGFSITYEMHATAVLDMLDLAGLPLRSVERTDTHPLILAGGPAVLNPEPLADFFDAIFLGEAEEGIIEIVRCLKNNPKTTKREKLEALASIPGTYVPCFYKPRYKDGSFVGMEVNNHAAPETIRVRTCTQLRLENYPLSPIVPFVETVHDRLTIEIMRGCSWGCRFCQAAYQYRPRRVRQVDDIVEHLQLAIESTGYEEVTLLALSATDHPQFAGLVATISPLLERCRISLSLPSLRPGTLSQWMLTHLSTQRRSGVTLAPEAGSERLRHILGKDIDDEEIYAAVEQVFAADWPLIKLYYMIGLPGETAADIDAIAKQVVHIARLAKSYGRDKRVNVTISPFCPKPGTPWQWEQQLECAEIEAIYGHLRHLVSANNVRLKLRHPGLAELEGILGRGDRRLAQVILEAFRRGACRDGWSEHFSFNIWQESFKVVGLDHRMYLAARNPDDPLPWEHINKGIPKRALLIERERSRAGLVSRKQSRTMEESKFRPSPMPVCSRLPTSGRSVIGLRAKYSRDERLRFFSHLDIMRAIHRAARRAHMPVAYSAGYHSHPKISLGPPLPVGCASHAEYLDILLEEPVTDEQLAQLDKAFPDGMRLVEARRFAGRTMSLCQAIRCVAYAVRLSVVANQIEESLQRLAVGSVISFSRNDRTVTISCSEIRPRLKVVGNSLEMLLDLSGGSRLRPDEVMTYCLGLPESEARKLIYWRTAQFAYKDGLPIDPLDLIDNGT